MAMLDSLIRGLGLASLDAHDPRVSRFAPRAAPVVVSSGTQDIRQKTPEETTYYAPQDLLQLRARSGMEMQAGIEAECWCSSYTIAQLSPSELEIAPLWSHTPAWMNEWTEGDVRKEECRRLVWSTVILAAGFFSYNDATNRPQQDLYITDAANFALLFPGESMFHPDSSTAKDSVWPLYMRALLLWNGSVRMHQDPTMSEADKIQYAMDAWRELDVIEDTLSRHTCNIERTFMFVSRDYLFVTRLCIFNELRQGPLRAEAFEILRRKAEEWITHHNSMAKRTMLGLHTVTGQPTSALSLRPFYLWWFIGQISRIIKLWSGDHSLAVALQACKSLFELVEYLMALWPCDESQRRLDDLHNKMVAVCDAAGVHSPQAMPF